MAGIGKLLASYAEITQVNPIWKKHLFPQKSLQSRSVKIGTCLQKLEKLKPKKRKRENGNLPTET